MTFSLAWTQSGPRICHKIAGETQGCEGPACSWKWCCDIENEEQNLSCCDFANVLSEKVQGEVLIHCEHRI